MSIWDLNTFTPTNTVKGICSYSSCLFKERTISIGDPAYHSKDLGIIFHRNCFYDTKMYKDGLWLEETDRTKQFDEKEFSDFVDSLESGLPKNKTRSKSFWERHRTKIIFGMSAAVAIASVAISLMKPEDLHTICLQSADNPRDLFCCVKQVSADITKCTFKLFEPANIWTDAGDPREYLYSELPRTNPETVNLAGWAVSGAQKLFQIIFN